MVSAEDAPSCTLNTTMFLRIVGRGYVSMYLHSEEDCSPERHISICNHLPDPRMCPRSDKASLRIHLCLLNPKKCKTVVKTVTESAVPQYPGNQIKLSVKNINLITFLINYFFEIYFKSRGKQQNAGKGMEFCFREKMDIF